MIRGSRRHERLALIASIAVDDVALVDGELYAIGAAAVALVAWPRAASPLRRGPSPHRLDISATEP